MCSGSDCRKNTCTVNYLAFLVVPFLDVQGVPEDPEGQEGQGDQEARRVPLDRLEQGQALEIGSVLIATSCFNGRKATEIQ